MSSQYAHDIARRAVEKHGAMQKPRELAAFIDFLEQRQLRNVLEVGGNWGGTMHAWAELATGRLVCVDNFVLDGRMQRAPLGYTLVCADSHHPETVGAVRRALHGEQVDLLFIDGDHSLAGVTADFDTYAPLVAPGGVIALHDTAVPHENVAAHNVIPLWKEVRQRYVHFQIFDPLEQPEWAPGQPMWGGIGVLFA